MTDGDIDMQAPGGLPTSASDSSTLNLRDDEQDPLTQQMKMYSAKKKWLRMIDDNDWSELLESVLLMLTGKLPGTTLKNKVIAPLTSPDAEDMVAGFNEEQMTKYKDATRKGVENDDWTDLINLSTSCTVH